MYDYDKVYKSTELLLEGLGEDLEREGLKETPHRIAKMYQEIIGNKKEPKITLFENTLYDEMIICKDIQFYSFCEHHLLPFFGKVHIAYIPDKSYIGLSKFGRIVDYFANGLNIQENLTMQIATFIQDKTSSKGVGIIMEAEHLCMSSRGIKKPKHKTITSCLLGCFREQEVRNEFLLLTGIK